MSTLNPPPDRLTAVFRDVFDDASLVLRDDLQASDVDNWDSLTHIDLIVAVEKEFRIRFTTREVQSLQNVGDLRALIAKKTSDPR